MTRYKVGYFVGNLATKSINRLLAKALVRLAPTALELQEIVAADAVLFVTPNTTGPFLAPSRTRLIGPAGPTAKTRSRESPRR